MRRTLANRIAPKDPDDDTRLGVTARGALGTVADFFGVAVVIGSFVGVLIGATVAQAILAVALAALTFIFMGLTFQLQRRFTNESRRAQANPMLVQCHEHLRDGAVALNRDDSNQFTVHIALAARALAAAFQQATGEPCRIAIQSITAVSKKKEDTLVETICRSFVPDHDSREAGLVRHAVAGQNTDYLTILEGQRAFFSNDLTSVRHYMNSDFDVRSPESEWPYRSVIVVPIVGPDLDPEEKRPQVIGFLCVDSNRKRVFARHLDVPTAKSVASALYSSLSLYRALRVTESKEPVPGAQA